MNESLETKKKQQTEKKNKYMKKVTPRSSHLKRLWVLFDLNQTNDQSHYLQVHSQ